MIRLLVLLGWVLLSPGAQGQTAGLYQILSGSYTTCCGIAGAVRSALPTTDQAFFRLSTDQQSSLWRMIFRSYQNLGRDLPDTLRDVEEFNWLAARNFVPKLYDGRATLFWASNDLRAKFDLIEGWQTLARAVDIHEVPGTHLDIIKEPYVAELAAKLRSSLALSPDSH